MTVELNVNRRCSLHHSENVSLSSTSSSGTSRVGEVAGVTVVECAAVCCCPCAVFNFIMLTFYRLPVGLYRRATRHRRRIKFQSSREWSQSKRAAEDVDVVIEANGDVEEMENDMLEWFNGAGFWRSASQRMKLNNPL